MSQYLSIRFQRIFAVSSFSAPVPQLVGGDDGIRTHDPLLAGQVLSQLSYTPISLWSFAFSLPLFCLLLRCPEIFISGYLNVSTELSSRTVARKVFSPLQSLTSVFGMGTGGPSALK